MKKLPFIILLASLSLHAFALPGPTSASFDKGVKFTVSGYTGASTLSGFPVLVRIAENSPSGFSYDDLQSKATGDDIAFVDMDGTGLPFEIDTWDPNGTSLIWVRLPSMQSGTEFVMCWGSDSSGKAVCNANPWSAYTGVWHMNETGTPSSANPVTIHDSTANGLDGSTPVGKAADESVIGGAWRIAEDQNHDRAIRVPVGGSGADPAKKAAADALGTDFHASFWVRAKGVVQWSNLICRRKGDQGAGWGFSFHENSGGAPKLMRVYAGSTTPATTSGTYNLGTTLCATDDVWKKIDIVWKYAANNNVQIADIYLNGAYLETVTCKETVNQQDTDIGIGCSTQDVYAGTKNNPPSSEKGRRANAEMDEVRLGAFVPSADWIAAEYATQTSPSFLTAGMAEPYGETDDPVAGVQVSDVAYTNATVTATVVKRGGAATSADVTVELATASDFASSLWTTNYTVSTDGDIQAFPVTGLSFGTSYYVRAVVSNTLDVVLTTPATSFTTPTPGSPAGTATFQERGFTTLSATGAAASFGTGAQSATLRLEASTDGFATIAGASAEVSAVAGAAETALTVSNLVPATSYALRLRIRNDWGVDTFVALPDAATRDVPFATTGLGWTFSPDGSTVDVTFGVSGIYDGATGSATLYYGESANPTTPQGAKPVNTAGDLLWQSLPVSAKTMYAKVVLSATLAGTTYTQTYTAPLTAGSTSVAVSDIMNHVSAATAVRVRPGDVVTLPELSGTARYIVGNKLFGSLEGNVLTALRPGILGIHCVGNDGATNTMAVLVLPETVGNGNIYILKDESFGNNWGYWNEASKWEKLGSETNDSFPHEPGDIAIVAFYRNTGLSLDARDDDVELAELYAGGYRDDKSTITLRCATSGKKNKYSFRRTDGRPVLVQLCSNSTYLGNNTYRTTLALGNNNNNILGIEFLSDTILSGGWDGTHPNFPQGRFEFSAPTNRIADDVTVTLVEMDTQGQSMRYTTYLGNLSGGGTFWNRSAAMVRIGGDSGSFTGLLRDSGGRGAGTTDRTGPMFVRTSTTTNCTGETIGWVPRSGGEPDSDFTRGIGCFQTGGTHSYQVPDPHDPWFTKKGFSMHGGMLRIGSDGTTAWGTRPDKRLVDFFRVGGGFNYIYGYNNNANNNVAWFEADTVFHEGTGTLRIRDQSLFESSATNMVTILHGVSAHAVGGTGNPASGSDYPIVPWIATQAGPKAEEDMRFAAFDGNGRLVRIAHAADKNKSLSDYGANDNAYLWEKGISLSADTTFNSLSIANDKYSKQLGEGRMLTLTSGGLILEDVSWMDGSSGIGTEDGGAANGRLVLGDADHPAYVWARGADAVSAKAGPNEIWAEVTAPGGFVSAHTGTLVLGGNQTNILEELVVNAGVLQLGSATTPCRLRKELPIRLYANATLKLPNADSTGGKFLQFDGAAGWFGKVEVGEGVAAKCKKAFIRDYPESPEWETLPRGVYGSSESAATGEFVRDDLFTGSGTLEVITDDRVVPSLMIFR